jgi:hypothetical protein
MPYKSSLLFENAPLNELYWLYAGLNGQEFMKSTFDSLAKLLVSHLSHQDTKSGEIYEHPIFYKSRASCKRLT